MNTYVPSENSKNRFLLSSWLYIVFCLGFLLKIKNTSNTDNVTTVGGAWNLVTILLYFVWLYMVFSNKMRFRLLPYYLCAFLFAFFSVFSSIANAHDFSISFLYNLAIIPYFMIVLNVFENIGRKYGEKSLNTGLCSICFFVIAIFVGYHLLRYENVGGERYVITDVYYALNMLPLVLMSKRSFVKYSAIVVTVGILILSGKRTGFVAFLLGLLVFFIVYNYCGGTFKEKRKNLIMMLTATMAILMVFFILTIRFDLNFFERLKTALEDGEGGRELIWGKILGAIQESPEILVLGRGLKTVPELIGKKNALAHCDFLEIVYDNGIVPLLFYIGFWLFMVKKTFSLIKEKNPLSAPITFSLTIAAFLSMFSNFVIDATYITYNMITFGLVFGISSHQKELKNEKSHSC